MKPVVNSNRKGLYVPANKQNIWALAMEAAHQKHMSISEYTTYCMERCMVEDGIMVEVEEIEKGEEN